MDFNDEYDVVVAGSGMGGLAAALAAAEMGLRPLLCEKASKLGGTTAVANGLWVGCNHIAAAQGYEDNREDVVRYLRFVGGDQLDEDRFTAFVDHSPRALKFFEDCGVRFRVCKGFVDHYWDAVPGSRGEGRLLECEPISDRELGQLAGRVLAPFDHPGEMTLEEEIAWGGATNHRGWDMELIEQRRAAGVRGRGGALVIHMVKQLQARNVPIRLGVAVERLIVEDGRVAGVETSDGGTVRAARGVVLATGGYGSDRTLAERFENVPDWSSMYPPSHTGDALKMAGAVGAGVKVIHNNLALFLGFDVPEIADPEAPSYRMAGIMELFCPHTVVVNQRAERFADESYFQTVATKLREYDAGAHAAANLPAYLIFDSQYAEKFSFAGGAVGAPIPDWVARADTVEGLADRLGLDPDRLDRTLERFNGFARTGIDDDFHRPSKRWSLARRESWEDGRSTENPSLGTIEQSPFYGLRLTPAAFVSAGLTTDCNGRVVDYAGAPIPGLYAVGDAAAKDDYGVGYQAGTSWTSGMTFGYLAAAHMSGAAAGTTDCNVETAAP